MGEVLTQAEINQLIADLSTTTVSLPDKVSAKEPENKSELSEQKSGGGKKIKSYDFRIPEKFSRYHIHTAHALNDMFARLLSTALSVYLKAKVEVEVASVDQMTYEEYSKSIVVSSVNVVFAMAPLPGSSIVQFSLPVVFTSVDRLLGGPGWSFSRERELTDLERALIEGMIKKVLQIFKEAWATVTEINPEIEIIECNPMFLPRIASPKEAILLATFEIKVNETGGIMSICIPYGVIEPIIATFSSSEFWAGNKDKEEAEEATLADKRKVIEGLPIPVVVELGNAEISLKELINLSPGNVICLNKSVRDSLNIKLMGVLKFLGHPGMIRDSIGMVVDEVLHEPNEEVDFYEFD